MLKGRVDLGYKEILKQRVESIYASGGRFPWGER